MKSETRPVIRIAAASDSGQISAIYAPYVLNTAISFETEPPSAEEMRERISETATFWPWLVFERDEVLGYAYAGSYRTRAAYQWSASVSVYVDSQAHRAGVGRALYASLFRLLELQGICNLYAGITLPNDASVGLHSAFGFQQISLERSVGYKLGAWHDVSIWHMALRPCLPDPQPPLPITKVAKTNGWVDGVSAGLRYLRL